MTTIVKNDPKTEIKPMVGEADATEFLEFVASLLRKEPNATPCFYYYHKYAFSAGNMEFGKKPEVEQKLVDVILDSDLLKSAAKRYDKAVDVGSAELLAQAIAPLIATISAYYDNTKNR